MERCDKTIKLSDVIKKGVKKMWKEVEKDGNPENPGIYLCARKNVEYPFSLIIEYFTGYRWAAHSDVFPITHWREVPQSPTQQDCINGMCC